LHIISNSLTLLSIDLIYFIHLFIFIDSIFFVSIYFVAVSFYRRFIIVALVYDCIILNVCLFFGICISSLIFISFVFLGIGQVIIFVFGISLCCSIFLRFVIYLKVFNFLLLIIQVWFYFSIILIFLNLQLTFKTFLIKLIKHKIYKK
jgi:hypothetical protein